MPTITPTFYRDQALEEFNKVPQEYLPALIRMIQAFRESFALPSAEESFQQGWREARKGETRPVSELWDGIDAE